MQPHRVNVTPRAEADIEQAFRWIAAEAPANAVRWIHQLMQSIESLCRMPCRFGVAPESPVENREVRQRVFGSYRILFTIEGDVVTVLCVRHSARRPANASDLGLHPSG